MRFMGFEQVMGEVFRECGQSKTTYHAFDQSLFQFQVLFKIIDYRREVLNLVRPTQSYYIDLALRDLLYSRYYLRFLIFLISSEANCRRPASLISFFRAHLRFMRSLLVSLTRSMFVAVFPSLNRLEIPPMMRFFIITSS